MSESDGTKNTESDVGRPETGQADWILELKADLEKVDTPTDLHERLLMIPDQHRETQKRVHQRDRLNSGEPKRSEFQVVLRHALGLAAAILLLGFGLFQIPSLIYRMDRSSHRENLTARRDRNSDRRLQQNPSSIDGGPNQSSMDQSRLSKATSKAKSELTNQKTDATADVFKPELSLKLAAARLDEIEVLIANLETDRLQAKANQVSRSFEEQALSPAQMESVIFAVADQSTEIFGGSKALVRADLRQVIESYPHTEGSVIATEILEATTQTP